MWISYCQGVLFSLDLNWKIWFAFLLRPFNLEQANPVPQEEEDTACAVFWGSWMWDRGNQRPVYLLFPLSMECWLLAFPRQLTGLLLQTPWPHKVCDQDCQVWGKAQPRDLFIFWLCRDLGALGLLQCCCAVKEPELLLVLLRSRELQPQVTNGKCHVPLLWNSTGAVCSVFWGRLQSEASIPSFADCWELWICVLERMKETPAVRNGNSGVLLETADLGGKCEFKFVYEDGEGLSFRDRKGFAAAAWLCRLG